LTGRGKKAKKGREGRKGRKVTRGKKERTRHDNIEIPLCLQIITPSSIKFPKFKMTMIDNIMIQLDFWSMFKDQQEIFFCTCIDLFIGGFSF
jgi:hypothetical protein